MALIKCPECNKEISDKVTACPHCGYPLSETNSEKLVEEYGEAKQKNKTNKKKSIKVLVIICVVVVLIGIGIGTYFAVTAKERNYNKAIELYNSGNYSDSLIVFKEISDYEDSEDYIEKCNYELSVNGQFLRALATGLEKRWDLNYKDEADGKNTTTEQFREFLNAEYDQLKPFSNQEFEDKELGEMAKKYIKLLSKALSIVKYYGSNNNTFWSEYNPIYDERCILIKKISDNYIIPVKEERKTELNDLITNGEYTIEIQKIMKNIEFKKVSDEYGYKQYEAIVKNTSSTDFSYFSFNVNLIDKNGTVVETQSPYTDNWTVGSKHKFTFSTDEKFEKIVVNSCNYS